ncbi:MAG: DNA alkylation repair protein [Candidatus Levybacteria bacterium]|nr:DNA alkylation repair protein [Candidatus Levybacteria bacterium]
MNSESVKKDLQKLSDPKKAKILSRFFKTGKGQYGEGDIFLGIPVPNQRRVAKRYVNLPLNELEKLLNSKIHEHRLTALLILVDKYKKTRLDSARQEIFDFYLKNTKNINNWDLVDLSAPNIVGNFLLNSNRNVLYKLANSKNLWEKRIAVLATYAFIKNNQFEDTLKISQILLKDKHDLMHKAVGWMLREVGKRNQEIEEEFLKKYYKQMPRAMLRYAIEKFSEEKRRFYLKKK